VRELALHILDVLENAIEAGATRIEVSITEDTARDRLTIVVADNGRGMDEDVVQRASDPFFTTRQTRHVGLGLPLLRAAALRCHGELTIRSQPGAGTRLTVTLQRSHIDRPPLGDMPGTLLGALLSQRAFDLRFEHHIDGRVFAFDTVAMRQALQGVPFAHPAVRTWLHEFLTEGYAALHERIEGRA
jgi:anti-sigma regulatory factor (Ser/Thr protein kinase)